MYAHGNYDTKDSGFAFVTVKYFGFAPSRRTSASGPNTLLEVRTLRVKQASISKMERRSDMYISTLSNIIRAMGGELQIIAKMPNGRVRIRQFTRLRKS